MEKLQIKLTGARKAGRWQSYKRLQITKRSNTALRTVSQPGAMVPKDALNLL